MQIYPNPVQNEPNEFFLLTTSSTISSINNIQRLLKLTARLTIQHANPPLLPSLVAAHHNDLSSVFASMHSPLLNILQSLSTLSANLNVRAGFLNAYSFSCRQTQKSIDILKSLRQKSVIDQRRVDKALSEMQAQKGLEIEAKDALDNCSNELKRDVNVWRVEYCRLMDACIEMGVDGQKKCHQDMITVIESALDLL